MTSVAEPGRPIIAADAADAAHFSNDRSRVRVSTEYENGAASAASAAEDHHDASVRTCDDCLLDLETEQRP